MAATLATAPAGAAPTIATYTGIVTSGLDYGRFTTLDPNGVDLTGYAFTARFAYDPNDPAFPRTNFGYAYSATGNILSVITINSVTKTEIYGNA